MAEDLTGSEEQIPAQSKLQTRILAVFPDLPNKQRNLARFFMENEDLIAFASAQEIATRVGTSAATVVRFSRTLGYEGFTDLQNEIRINIPQFQTYVQKLADRLSTGDLKGDLINRVQQSQLTNLEKTIRNVHFDQLVEVAELIQKARRIRVFGGGLSASMATLLEYHLSMLNFPARAFLNGGVRQAMELSQLGPQDVVFVVSVWRYLKDSVNAARSARKANAKCVVLTDSYVSPLTSQADIVLYAATEGATHSRSMSGMLALIELLSNVIVSMAPETSMESLRKIDAFYRQQGLLYKD